MHLVQALQVCQGSRLLTFPFRNGYSQPVHIQQAASPDLSDAVTCICQIAVLGTAAGVACAISLHHFRPDACAICLQHVSPDQLPMIGGICPFKKFA